MNKLAKAFFLIAGALGLSLSAHAYDSAAIRNSLDEALSFPGHSRFRAAQVLPSCAPANSVITPDTRQAKLDAIDQAYSQLIATCQGRANELQNTLRRQTVRAEGIAAAGGIAGVISTIATCPHCAALFGGLAGLANPLQQTAEKYNDTPSATQTQLTNLSKTINDALNNYNALPAPSLCDTDADFLAKLQKRADAINAANLTCATYYTVATTGTSSTAPGSPTNVTAKKNAQDPLAVDVSFTPPASDGNSKITGYKVYARDKSGTTPPVTATGTATPITVKGLTKGHTYTIQVTAINDVNPSSPGTDPDDYTVQ